MNYREDRVKLSELYFLSEEEDHVLSDRVIEDVKDLLGIKEERYGS